MVDRENVSKNLTGFVTIHSCIFFLLSPIHGYSIYFILFNYNFVFQIRLELLHFVHITERHLTHGSFC